MVFHVGGCYMRPYSNELSQQGWQLYYSSIVLRLACGRLTLKVMFEFSVSQYEESD